jgi:hypothetical protein
MDITITIAAADEVRVQEAFGFNLGLGHPAEQPEIADEISKWVESTTQNYERMQHNTSFVPDPIETEGR